MTSYGAETTAEQVVQGEKADLKGKNVLVTGGYTGIK